MTDQKEVLSPPEKEKGARQGKRVTVSLRPSDLDRLGEIASETHLSQNDAIRKALATEAFVQRALAEGRKILVEDAEGNVRYIEFVS